MFTEIKKVLARIKKGVVIVEDGAPRFVVIPFEDFTERERSAEDVARYSVPRRHEPKRQVIDDASLIQKMIDYDATMRSQDFGREAEAMELLNRLEEEQETEPNKRARINLEDLPF